MKTILVFAGLIFCILPGIHSQLADKELYFFDEFQDATVNFRDESEKNYKLNFCFLYNELCFLDERTEMVMAVKNINAVDDFEIDGRVFFIAGKNLMEVLCDKPLLYVQYKKSVRPAAEGGYGTITETSSVETYTPRTDSWMLERRMAHRFKIGEMDISYIITEENGSVQTFRNSKQLQKLYPDYKDEIKNFVKKYSVKFENTEQVLTLISFIASL